MKGTFKLATVLLVGLILLTGWTTAVADDDDDALHDGGARLEALQNNDGGWDWPLDDGDPNSTSPLNTVGPIGMGLARAYWNGGEAAYEAALTDAGSLLLSKTNNFSPSDGYLAAMLDSIFGGTTYRDHVLNNFYIPLENGTYNRNGAGTLYDTSSYIESIYTSRSSWGGGNLAAWDVGMGLVGAVAAGADPVDWVSGTEEMVNRLVEPAWYDVIGLAGAVYGLAFAGEDFDPTAGAHAGASCLADLANILAGYQIPATGGFTWESDQMDPGVGNETVQETAYAILALNEVDRQAYLDAIEGAADWLVDFQLGTGGWKNWDGGAENNEVTGEAMWGIHAVYVEDVWVDENGNDHVFGFGYIPFETLAKAVSAIGGTNGTIHIGNGTFTLGPGTYVTRVFIEGNADVSAVGATTIERPGSRSVTVAESGATYDPIVFAYGGTMDSSGNVSGPATINMRFSGFDVDGTNSAVGDKRLVGILLRNVIGEVSGNTLHDLYDSDGEGNGPQTFGIMVYGDSAVDVLNNTISDFSRGGIGIMGDAGSAPDPVAHVEGNTVTGNGMEAGTGWWAENGIQFGYGASGEIVGNTVTDCAVNNPDWTATGIIVVDTDNVLVAGNIVNDNETGISVTDFPGAVYGPPWDASAVSNVTVQGNSLDGNDWALDIANDVSDVAVLFNVFTNTTNDAIDVYSYDYYFPGLGIPYPSNVVLHYNSITGSGGDGLWVMDGIGSPVDAILNWWGDVNGPSGEGTGGGDSVSTNVIFSPWLGTAPDGDPTQPGVQITGPMLIIVAPVGPQPTGGYLNAAIAGANSADLPDHDTIEVRHGTYDATEPITGPVDIVSEPGSAAHTTLNGPIAINAPAVLIGRLGQGFTIHGPITVGAGIDASTIHINWNDIYDLVTNNGDNTLDATFNYWGEDGPDTVGLVDVYPYLPDPSDTIIGYMDEHGFDAIEAIHYANLLDLYLSAHEALVGTELMETFGFTEEEAADIIDEYGAFLVGRALTWSRGDYDQFMVLLLGYGVGGGGGGGLAEGEVTPYTVGDSVPLVIELLNPITGEVTDDALVSYTVTRTSGDGTPEIVMFGVMPFDGDMGAYAFDLDTSTLEPGIYDIWLGTDDGRSYHYQIELTE